MDKSNPNSNNLTSTPLVDHELNLLSPFFTPDPNFLAPEIYKTPPSHINRTVPPRLANKSSLLIVATENETKSSKRRLLPLFVDDAVNEAKLSLKQDSFECHLLELPTIEDDIDMELLRTLTATKLKFDDDDQEEKKEVARNGLSL